MHLSKDRDRSAKIKTTLIDARCRARFDLGIAINLLEVARFCVCVCVSIEILNRSPTKMEEWAKCIAKDTKFRNSSERSVTILIFKRLSRALRILHQQTSDSEQIRLGK